MDLNEARQQIDTIDAQITNLFERRMNIAVEIAKFKQEHDIPILNEQRERLVIAKNVALLKDKSLEDSLILFYQKLMELSRNHQKSLVEGQVVVGYQGVEGAFGYIATGKFFKGMDALEKKDYKEFADVFEALKSGEIDFGVLPIENSSTGAISETVDLLNEYDCYIEEEIFIRAEQNLLGTQEASIESIQQVFSHSQGFAQSTKFLEEHPEWELIPYQNTAVSAKHVSKMNNPHMAAIASKEAADLYGLKILAENIVNNRRNFTRFIKISRKLKPLPGSNKISILFSVKHVSGSLNRVLKAVSDNSLNMLSLESRPIPNRPWEYYFYLDLEGSIMDSKVLEALRFIEKETTYFKILGCYPREVF